MKLDGLVKYQIWQNFGLSPYPMLLAAVFTVTLTACTGAQRTLGINSPATATDANQGDYLRRHVYVGAGVGVSKVTPDTSDAPNFDVRNDSSVGAQLTLGMDFSPLLSFEGHLSSLGSAEISPQGDISYALAGVSALFYVGGNRDRYKRRGLTGYGRLTSSLLSNSASDDVPFNKDNTAHIGLGAGLEFMTDSGLGVRAEAISFTKDALYAQLGVIYRFGRQEKPKAPIAPVPEPEAENRCHGLTGVLDGVNFLLNSAELTDDAVTVLDGIADTLAKCENVPIHLSAHTDSTGTDEYNIDLSRRRADSVISHLESRGISRSRMTSEVFGESMPIDSNETLEGRRRNRRVELKTR